MPSNSLRAVTAVALLALAGAAAIAACYQPSFEACGVRCEPGGGCPDETSCGLDGFCHGGGEAATCTSVPTPDAMLLDDGGTPPDARPADASVPPGASPVARLISTAYYSGSEASAGMAQTSFTIATNGVHDGDLVLFVASIDNGSNTVFPNPIATGFHQLTQQFYGNDGQTFVVQYKIADHEPVNYSGTYGSGLGSGASVLNLVAFTNFDPAQPINAVNVFHAPQGTADATPVFGNSPGVTTTVAHCLLVYASGADWGGANGTNTFEPPTGFTPLAEFGDHGDHSWDWTSQQIDTRVQDAAGVTGPVSGSLTGTFNATAWTVLLAVAPKP
jgi:hypothetical protein